jgi:hypothetical protein
VTEGLSLSVGPIGKPPGHPPLRGEKDKRDNINKHLKVIGCEDGRWMTVVQNNVQ